jgi:hypothetical protein
MRETGKSYTDGIRLFYRIRGALTQGRLTKTIFGLRSPDYCCALLKPGTRMEKYIMGREWLGRARSSKLSGAT